VKFGAEVDQATLEQLARGERCREALKQPLHKPLGEAEEIAILYAVVQGLLDALPTAELARFELEYVTLLRRAHPALLSMLAGGQRMDETLEHELRASVEACLSTFVAEAGPEESRSDLGDAELTEKEVSAAT